MSRWWVRVFAVAWPLNAGAAYSLGWAEAMWAMTGRSGHLTAVVVGGHGLVWSLNCAVMALLLLGGWGRRGQG